ncbi:MAG: GNAT family N-acetyltransferase [Chloroflexi bacterium]|nr:GNAT family N-acetyltransferase [Chloroflexota bacterium]
MIINTNLLRGDRVHLTAFREDDASTMARWSEDMGYLRLQETNLALPRTKAAIAADLEGQSKSSNTLVFAIRPVDGDELIGFVGFYEIEWANQVAWFGIGIGDRSNWGKGYGSEAMHLALWYAFCELNLYGLHLTVIDYNERAIALYEKMGFQREGVFRQFGWRDGKRYDMILYGILRPEWESR